MPSEAMRVSNLILYADEDDVALRASVDDLASAADVIEGRDDDQSPEWKGFEIAARGTKNKSDETRHFKQGTWRSRSIGTGRSSSSPQLDNPSHSAPTKRQVKTPHTKHHANPTTYTPHKCSTCPSYFKSAAGLSRHQRAHDEARIGSSLVNRPPTSKAATANQYLCEFCPASYSHFGYLMRHRVIHFD